MMLQIQKYVYSCKCYSFQSWDYIQEYCPYASIGGKIMQFVLLQMNIQRLETCCCLRL